MLVNSIFLFIRLFVTLLSTLYISRVVLSELGVSDYGLYNVVAGVITMLTFLTSAMTSSTLRFFSFELGKGVGRLTNIFRVTIFIYLIIICVVIVLSQTLGLWFLNTKLSISLERIDAAHYVFQISVITFIISVLTAPFDAVIFSQERFKAYSIFGIVSIVFKLVSVIILKYAEWDKLVFYSATVLANNVVLFLMSFGYVVKCRFVTRLLPKWDYREFCILSSYTGWNFFGNFSSVCYNQGVNILLNIYFGVTVNAARAVANQVNAAVLGFTTNLNAAISPQIIKRYSKGDYKEMKCLVFRGSKYAFLLISILSLPILIYTDVLLTFWLVEVPPEAVLFTKLVVIDSLISGFSGSLKSSVEATGRVKYYQMVIGGILLLNLPISYMILTTVKKPEVPFLISILLSLFAFQGRLVFIKLYHNISLLEYYREVIIKSIIPIFITLSVVYLIYANVIFSSFEFEFIFINIVMFLSMLISIWYFSLDAEEKYYCNNLKNKIFGNRNG
ncbi:lipopolysaccharide biosynthesis protein [Proteus terrae]|uniref:lipopolysaccharide biosynthesis protein n=1 Tax=Proteus terrae TaxID=1574161 RepID=UPI0034E50335